MQVSNTGTTLLLRVLIPLYGVILNLRPRFYLVFLNPNLFFQRFKNAFHPNAHWRPYMEEHCTGRYALTVIDAITPNNLGGSANAENWKPSGSSHSLKK